MPPMSKEKIHHRPTVSSEVTQEMQRAVFANADEFARIDLVLAAMERVSGQGTSLSIAEGKHLERQSVVEDYRRSLRKEEAALAVSEETIVAMQNGFAQARQQLKERLITMFRSTPFAESPMVQAELPQYLHVIEHGSCEAVMEILRAIRRSMTAYTFFLNGGEVVPERETNPVGNGKMPALPPPE